MQQKHLRNITLNRLIYRLRHQYMTFNNVVILLAGVVALGWAWGSVEAMQRNYELQQMINDKKHRIAVETLQTELLQYERNYYASAEYQELAVRQRLGKGLPGERVIIVPSTDHEAPQPRGTTDRTANVSNFQHWMNFLFGGKPHK